LLFAAAAAAVPCVLPRTLIGMWMVSTAWSIAVLASDSE
jgi:hypothetical protein